MYKRLEIEFYATSLPVFMISWLSKITTKTSQDPVALRNEQFVINLNSEEEDNHSISKRKYLKRINP